jgi:hypothetical protein
MNLTLFDRAQHKCAGTGVSFRETIPSTPDKLELASGAAACLSAAVAAGEGQEEGAARLAAALVACLLGGVAEGGWTQKE